MISSPRIVPWRNCLWDSSHYSSLLCVRSAVCLLCSPTSACTAPLWSYSSKRKKKDFFPCFTGTINVPWPSRLLLLSFSLILSLFPSPLWGFFSLLDGAEAEPQTNFSHSRNEAWRAQFVSLRGNRIHSSVPQKTPFFQTERELFVWWQLQLSSRSSCDSLQVQRCVMACCVHITGELCHHARWCLWRINQTVHRVPFSKMELPNDSKCEKQSTRNSSFDSSVLKKTLHEYQSHSMVLKRERSRGGAGAFIAFRRPLLIIWPRTHTGRATCPLDDTQKKQAQGFLKWTAVKAIRTLSPQSQWKYLMCTLFFLSTSGGQKPNSVTQTVSK